mgnify:CR=1 FL=1
MCGMSSRIESHRAMLAALLAVAVMLQAAETAPPARVPRPCTDELPRRLDDRLDDAMREQLAEGEIQVIDDVFERDYPRAVAVAVMKCDPADAWRFLKNFEAHPRWMPYCERVEVHKQDDGSTRYRHVYKPAGRGPFTLEFREEVVEEAKVICWSLAGDGDGTVRNALATWHVREFGEGQSLIAFRGAGDVDVMIPDFMLDYFLGGALGEMLEALRDQLVPESEQLGAARENAHRR